MVVAIFTGACTGPVSRTAAECSALPNVVLVSPDQIRIRSGLRTLVDIGESTPRELYERLEALKTTGEVRAACSGVADVVAADDDTDPVRVMMAVAARKQECETPVRVVLGSSEPPVPISAVHFCGCRATRPFAYCSSQRIDVWPDRVHVERVAMLVGTECSPGALAMLGPGDVRPQAPPSVGGDYVGPDRVTDAFASLVAPHGDLLSCRDAYLSFHTPQNWGEVRTFAGEYYAAHPHRITIDISSD